MLLFYLNIHSFDLFKIIITKKVSTYFKKIKGMCEISRMMSVTYSIFFPYNFIKINIYSTFFKLYKKMSNSIK